MKFFSRVIIACGLLVTTQCAYAQIRDPRCAAIPVATASDAKTTHQFVVSALAKFESDFGTDVFDKTSIQTADGPKTLGELWGKYLDDSGLPKDMAVRQCLIVDLVNLGLPLDGVDVLILGTADRKLIEVLIKNLATL